MGEFSASEFELVGAIIGDGHIHLKHPKYYFGLTGNKASDQKYFLKLAGLIENAWRKKANIFVSGGGLRIRVYSRKIVERLTSFYGLPFNAGKCYSVSIPKFLLEKFKNVRHVLRGIADTDSSVFVSDKPGSPNYPSLEITTVSKMLATQIRGILSNNGFRVTNLRCHPSKRSGVNCYKVCLYGKANLKKWISEIGFSNPIKLAKALAAIGSSF